MRRNSLDVRTPTTDAGSLDSPVRASSPADIQPLRGNDQCRAASALLAAIWGTSVDSSPLSSDLIRTVIHSGGCVLGVMDADQLVGVTVGIAGAPGSGDLYSLIAAVDKAHAGRGIGRALKHAQREWALQRGASRMVWTFDPLIRRNAHFNLNILGAKVVEYSECFYPPMHDLINRNDDADRLTVAWDLLDERAQRRWRPAGVPILDIGSSGEPIPLSVPAGPPCLLAATPVDIESLRRRDPDTAAAWRMSLRDALTRGIDAGYRISGLSECGHYVLERDNA